MWHLVANYEDGTYERFDGICDDALDQAIADIESDPEVVSVIVHEEGF